MVWMLMALEVVSPTHVVVTKDVMASGSHTSEPPRPMQSSLPDAESPSVLD